MLENEWIKRKKKNLIKIPFRPYHGRYFTRSAIIWFLFEKSSNTCWKLYLMKRKLHYKRMPPSIYIFPHISDSFTIFCLVDLLLYFDRHKMANIYFDLLAYHIDVSKFMPMTKMHSFVINAVHRMHAEIARNKQHKSLFPIYVFIVWIKQVSCIKSSCTICVLYFPSWKTENEF